MGLMCCRDGGKRFKAMTRCVSTWHESAACGNRDALAEARDRLTRRARATRELKFALTRLTKTLVAACVLQWREAQREAQRASRHQRASQSRGTSKLKLAVLRMTKSVLGVCVCQWRDSCCADRAAQDSVVSGMQRARRAVARAMQSNVARAVSTWRRGLFDDSLLATLNAEIKERARYLHSAGLVLRSIW